MWRIPDVGNPADLHKQARSCWEDPGGELDSFDWHRAQRSECVQQQTDATLSSISWSGQSSHTTASRWQQQSAGAPSYDCQASCTGNASSASCQCYTSMPCKNGNRFFWVGQRSRMSDSTDSSESSNLFTRALASQRSVNQQATFPPTSVPPSPFTSLHVPSHTASQPQSMPYKALPSLPRDKFSSMGCRPFDWSASESSDRICSASALPSLTSAATAAAASDTFQDLAASESCIDSLQTFPSSPFETMIENMGLAEEEEMWAADCPPEDVDKLLDWAAAPSLSDPNRDSAHLDMPAAFNHSSARPGPQCTLAAGGHPSCTLGVHHDSSTTMAAAWACPAVARPQHESSSDELCYSQISALEAYAEAASQLAAAGPQRTASAQMGLTSDPLGLLEQTEAAAPLDGAGYPSLAMPSLSSRDSSPSSANEAQAGGSAQTDMQKKRRCGRPRVYDLDGPVTVDGSTDAAAALRSQKAKGRGAKPKYIYSTAEEAIAKRRKRNRDTATQSYYNRKQRISMLTKQMEALREDNAALQIVFQLIQQNSHADKGWIREQLSEGKSPVSILQELHHSVS